MRIHLCSAIVFGLALSIAGAAQDAPAAPSAGQDQGQRGQYGGWGRGRGMMGASNRVLGTVTAVAADRFTIKTDEGETYTVHFGDNTRILKQGQGFGQGEEGGRRGGGREMGGGGNPPQTIKPADIKVGDAISAMGEIDTAAKSVDATTILQIDPERARQMREMRANYGKTWLMGRVTAIDGVKITLMGALDNAPHTFVADENTAFRKRREPITLADIQMGDRVRAEGAIKDGSFLATSVNSMGAPEPPPTVPSGASPQSQPK